ncbi:toxin-antitoxin system PIN domain toxin [Geodermatophilus saharensis]|uniref:Ribonuclease VapC n=1 Tax=Geodermatophilus saharensis TaxID=1137994 RepID=A0A239HGE5_9ACTN|nr:TA system VapC family ribonuclease toxin [Geodermatophilus saharensis]SNS80215.1 toxin-antitoxin system PIN domain toxin [Geodermatophilus saharensis]
MLVDANLLLYAVNSAAPQHETARAWWEAALSGAGRVGLPWQTIGAFVRITTHPRVIRRPLAAEEAWSYVAEWLDVDVVWIPPATERTAGILGDLLRRTGATGNLVPDAQLAALAIEHGVAVATADTDFARFPDVRWINPLD